MTGVRAKIMRAQVNYEEEVSGTLPEIGNLGTTCKKLREGAELRAVAD